jgi:hypothetical protein
MIQTPSGQTLLRKVNELIDPINQYWDEYPSEWKYG